MSKKTAEGALSLRCSSSEEDEDVEEDADETGMGRVSVDVRPKGDREDDEETDVSHD